MARITAAVVFLFLVGTSTSDEALAQTNSRWPQPTVTQGSSASHQVRIRVRPRVKFATAGIRVLADGTGQLSRTFGVVRLDTNQKSLRVSVSNESTGNSHLVSTTNDEQFLASRVANSDQLDSGNIARMLFLFERNTTGQGNDSASSSSTYVTVTE